VAAVPIASQTRIKNKKKTWNGKILPQPGIKLQLTATHYVTKDITGYFRLTIFAAIKKERIYCTQSYDT
jgi:hypothetical protein